MDRTQDSTIVFRTGKSLTRPEVVYCLMTTGTGVALILALMSLKGHPERVWIPYSLCAVILAMLPIGTLIVIVMRRLRFVVAVCMAFTIYLWFVFLMNLMHWAP